MSKLLLLSLFTFFACSMGKTNKHVRKPQDKIWRFCQDFETPNPLGKICNRTCLKRKCKPEEFTVTVKDMNDKETFLFFRNAGFIIIDEDQAL